MGERASTALELVTQGVPRVISPAAAHEWIGGELREVESIALSEGMVLDRAAVRRLSRSLAVVASLHDLHPVDEAGRCGVCSHRWWWSRRCKCAVWPLLAAHFAGYLATVGGSPGLRVAGS